MIQGVLLKNAMISAANSLANVKQAVDELNVFPVPDGDTGTNMSMTISAAARELSRLDNPTVSETADVASSALLRGARGNSGVILSLLFRGFSKGLKGKTEANGADLANALALGVEAAYKAVMKPTEGTILTVAREAAEAGKIAAETDADPLSVWTVICDEAEASLARTPELLPMLKKAGVVDAGGKGFCVIIEAMKDVFAGGEIVQGETPAAAPKRQKSAAASFETDITFTYCTEFIVARDKKVATDPSKLRAFLESIGDCVVVVDDEDIIKVHVHTNDPGRALHEAIEYGQFETVKVENMRIQHENAGWVDEEDPDAAADPVLERVEPENPFGFVAVAAGEGLEALFRDLGCDHGVSGGQTMNPSTDDILQAVEATPAEVVYVLPNNKNIILAAEQAVPLADREVRVLPTRTIPQGISAMLSFDGDASVEDNLLAMTQAADNVSTGQLTYAARNSDFDGHQIEEGQILALNNNKLAFVDTDLRHAAVKLCKTIVHARRQAKQDSSFITVIYGEDVTESQAEEISAAITEKFKGEIDVTLVAGGQPVYYYIFSIE
ncbi:MAG: DAK2 domain-containing protein [Clostridia bacterium]|nr:DAK2 domain-containing protein [Clostridia bacterium]